MNKYENKRNWNENERNWNKNQQNWSENGTKTDRKVKIEKNLNYHKYEKKVKRYRSRHKIQN